MDNLALMEAPHSGVDSSAGGGVSPTPVGLTGKTDESRAMTRQHIYLDRLETPAVVREQLAKLSLQLEPADLLRAEQASKLQYYFGGCVVAGRDTPDGFAVLVAGTPRLVESVLAGLSRVEAESYTLSTPDPLRIGVQIQARTAA